VTNSPGDKFTGSRSGHGAKLRMLSHCAVLRDRLLYGMFVIAVCQCVNNKRILLLRTCFSWLASRWTADVEATLNSSANLVHASSFAFELHESVFLLSIKFLYFSVKSAKTHLSESVILQHLWRLAAIYRRMNQERGKKLLQAANTTHTSTTVD